MTGASLWVAILALSAVTLATRAAVLFLPERVRLSGRWQRALRYAGPCILMAIVVPNLLRRDGAVDLGIDNIRLDAALIALVAFFCTRSATLMIVVGLGALTALRLLS